MKFPDFSGWIFTSLAVFLFASPEIRTRAEPAPASLPRHAFALDPKVDEWAQPLEVRKLMQDEVFLEVLRSVLARPDFTEANKADAFYLLLKKIRWNFSGAVQIPPNIDYPAFFNAQAGTFLDYQARLQNLRYDVAPLLRIAAEGHRANVVRAAHALLLAALLDRQAAAAAIRILLTPDELRHAQVPDILLHHLALAVVLARQPPLAAELDALWDATASEEGREDILCVLGIYRDLNRIRSRLAEEQDPAHDLTLETGLLLLKRCLPADAFSAASDEMRSTHPALAGALDTLRQRNFRSSTRTAAAFWKTWDGFDATLYDDGMRLTHGESFGDFIPGE